MKRPGEKILVFAIQFVNRGDGADGAVKPDAGILLLALYHKSPGIVKGVHGKSVTLQLRGIRPLQAG